MYIQIVIKMSRIYLRNSLKVKKPKKKKKIFIKNIKRKGHQTGYVIDAVI